MTIQTIPPFTCTVYPEDVVRRFWAKVDVRGPDDCWPWLASVTPSGYGQISINRRPQAAHRVAWQITYDRMLGDQKVEHSCENRICCNPNHVEFFKRSAHETGLTFLEKLFGSHFVTHRGCWIWMGSVRNRDGYGSIPLIDRQHFVHRVMWEVSNALEAENLTICHDCDDPRCVNPAHLYAGTDQTNADDRARRNRQAKGSGNGRSKLSESDIPTIRMLSAERGLSNREISDRYGIDPAAIRSIVIGKTWAHVE